MLVFTSGGFSTFIRHFLSWIFTGFVLILSFITSSAIIAKVLYLLFRQATWIFICANIMPISLSD
jgi:hypothetical protein